MPPDEDRFLPLLRARHPAISILTPEEEDALDVVLRAAVELGLDVLLWSNSRGVRDGLLEGGPGIPDTEHPAAALYHLSLLPPKPRVLVMLDLAPHLAHRDLAPDDLLAAFHAGFEATATKTRMPSLCPKQGTNFLLVSPPFPC
jgi:hypothetical protein